MQGEAFNWATLRRLRASGDDIGGGFHRNCVENQDVGLKWFDSI